MDEITQRIKEHVRCTIILIIHDLRLELNLEKELQSFVTEKKATCKIIIHYFLVFHSWETITSI